MKRYKPIRIISTEGNLKRKYVVTKYPEIPRGSSDIYVYVTKGDRYDLLAQTYYKDSSLWWIINRANPNQDAGSLFPTVGSQIRIPAPNRIPSIISAYEILNLQI
jgi:hypothetical protein